jgi:magnesium-transporting ATPase (P-type)
MEECFNQLKEALLRFWDTAGKPKDKRSFALVIDGASLIFALEEPCKQLFLEIGCRCKSVLCCRVSPLQKALVVRLVRNGLVL